MLIRYHIFYYALGCLLVVMGKYFHPLFYLMMIGYLFWIYYRFSYKHLIVMIVLVGYLLCIPQVKLQTLPTYLKGTVIKTSEKYCYVETEVGTVKVYHQEQFSYHDQIECLVEPLGLNENTNDNAFNEKLYLYSLKIHYKAQLVELKSLKQNPSLYQYIESKLSSKTDVENYQRLFLFGERSEDIQDDYQQLSQLSLVHLFALSGMHVHILYFLLKKIISIFFNKKISKWIAYALIGIYIFSIPMQISLYRAFFVLVIYELLKKWFHQLDVLSLLVIASVIYNPYIIFNISFVFSYFIYFIVLLTHDLKYSTVLIYLSSLPIVLTLNYQIPLIALLVGTIITPFIEFFYCLCTLSIFFSFLEVGISICVYLLRTILSFLEFFNTFIVFSKPQLSFIVMYYCCFFFIIYQITYRKKILKTGLILCSLLISFSFYSRYKIYGEITMIDVGQGDCTLIRLPMNQGNVLIDTGGNKDFDLATKTIIPYLKSVGIHSLDYVYISHGDFDHCGALESLQQNFDVKHVIDKYEKYRKIGDMEITMLNTKTYYSDINDQSLIMKVDVAGFSILFTGDASTVVEKELRDVYQHMDIDVLKVSHHGSQTASSTNLFELIQPSLAMIGVKKNNLYHHPSKEVIQRLERKNMTVLRTDNDGMFHIRFYGKSRYILK